MMAAKYATALCLASLGKVEDAVKLGFLTEAQRQQQRAVWKRTAELVGDDPAEATRGKIPSTLLRKEVSFLLFCNG
jgi:hypothetical protein